MTPLDILKQELLKYTKAKQKSIDAFNLDLIPENVHKEHLENLEPKIQEFKSAIHTLTIYGQ